MTADFATMADEVVNRAVDRASVASTAGARLMLVLLAMRSIASTDPGAAPSWRTMRNGVVYRRGSTDAHSSLREMARATDAARPGWGGLFTEELSSMQPGLAGLLAPWIEEVDALWPPDLFLPEGEFAGWFDAAIDRLAGRASVRLREHATPREVADLMVRLSGWNGSEEVYDPCSGVGSILAACARARPGKGTAPRLVGQEIDRASVLLSSLRMALLTGSPPGIDTGDTLREPTLDARGKLRRSGVGFCHPPFGQKMVDPDLVADDPHARFRHGTIGRLGTEFAFVQHALASVGPHGRVVAFMPLGPLFRGGGDGVARRALVTADLIEAVIGLPSGMLPGSGIETALLVLGRRGGRRGPGVLLVDASGRPGPSRDPAGWPALRDAVVEACASGRDPGGLSVMVDGEVLERNDFSLQPRIYAPVRAERRHTGDRTRRAEEVASLERDARLLASEMDGVLASLDDLGREGGARG